MKLIIDIPDEAYKQIIDFGFLERTHGKMCYEAIKKAIPFEQIRAEIEALNTVDYVSISSYEGHKGARDMKDDVLQIIDKYKAERSDKE